MYYNKKHIYLKSISAPPRIWQKYFLCTATHRAMSIDRIRFYDFMVIFLAVYILSEREKERESEWPLDLKIIHLI